MLIPTLNGGGRQAGRQASSTQAANVERVEIKPDNKTYIPSEHECHDGRTLLLLNCCTCQ